MQSDSKSSWHISLPSISNQIFCDGLIGVSGTQKLISPFGCPKSLSICLILLVLIPGNCTLNVGIF